VTLERKLAVAMSMDDATWLRHANPWSVWSRASVLPLVILAIWSRHWLGPWAWAAVAVAVAWMWANPRVFRRPKTMDNWASRGVLGERVWLNRDAVPVPERHRVVPHVLNVVTGAGTILVVWGLVTLAVWPTLLGSVLIYCGKLWFLDRMVWLYEDMAQRNDQYRAWLG
jgi:uncharacterized protein DUF6653